jgi:voltage-gated potassium channel
MPLRTRVHDIIFQHDSPGERLFDLFLLIAIVASIMVVMLDSVQSIATKYRSVLTIAEWTFTVLFTIEYALRVWSSPRRLVYMRSMYGIVDLLAILPAYLSIFFPAGRFLVSLRVLRVLRIFRILRLSAYVQEASVLIQALRASRFKIVVFVSAVLAIAVVVGAVMFLIEGPQFGFTNIPQSVYWAIVTLTTVGYGDIAPATTAGKVLASALMILGYGIIAVPTGIVTLELDRVARRERDQRMCEGCGSRRHEADASYCKYCGTAL